MLNKRLKVAIMTVVLGSLIFANTIYAKPANDVEAVHSEDVDTETNRNTSGISPRMMCGNPECPSIMQMDLICLIGTRKISGTRTHGNCTVTSYDANAAYYCYVCKNTLFLYDADQEDGYARHHCQEKHSSCGAGDNGNYNVCPFGG